MIYTPGVKTIQEVKEYFLNLYIQEYKETNITKEDFYKKHNIPNTTFYKWTKQNLQIKVPTVAQQNRDKINATRIRLYEKLKEEYTELTDRLQVVHHRMQMVGEEWD